MRVALAAAVPDAQARPKCREGMISRADVATHIVHILDDPATFGRALAMGTP
jgi:uncharacterized protein YbjT (DUF2867 family)